MREPGILLPRKRWKIWGMQRSLNIGKRQRCVLTEGWSYVDSPPCPAGEADVDAPVSDDIEDWLEAQSSKLGSNWMLESVATLQKSGFDIEVAGEDGGSG